MGYIGQAPANKAITSADIEDGVVSAADLGANSVDSSELVDGSIDTSHIADNQVTLAKMAGGTDGNIISYDASGDPVAIATGSDGEVLTSAGAGQPPAFEAVSAGTALTGSTNNTITTVTGANAISGEANLRFDGSELRVGSGTTSAQANGDDVVIEGSGNTGLTILSGNDDLATVYLGQNGANNDCKFEYDNDTNALVVHTNASERVRIDNGGRLFVRTGATFGDANALVYFNGDSSQNTLYISIGSNGYDGIRFYNASHSEVGSVQIDSTAVVYNTSSDYRLKENETAITDGIERIKQLKPYRFNFKVEPDKTVDGFFAHEVSGIVPEAITGEKDAMHPEVLYSDAVLYTEEVLYTADDELPEGKEIGDIKYAIGDIKTPADVLPEGKNFGDVKEETKIDPQGIDQSKLVPLLTSALQEAITKIEQLETKVTALENA